MRFLTADYIFPISSAPIKNGIIVVDDSGVVLGIQKNQNLKIKTENFPGILCPGFINSHCHLELSYLKGKIPEKTGLPAFIGEIEKIRRNFSEKEIQKSILSAETEMLKNGIVGIGDISNSGVTFQQKSKGKIKYHTFIEALGFHPDRANQAFEYCLQLFEKTKKYNLQSSITPHAPYSASKKLLKKISGFALKNHSIISIHNQENMDESQMFLTGKGKILERLKLLGIDISQWKPTGKNSLQSIFSSLPKKNKKLFVHNTFTTKNDIRFLKSKIQNSKPEIHFCFCPNANLFIENTLPDFEIFINNKCKIAVGTDSLASNWNLSILEELKTISSNSHGTSLHTLLTWATKNGAELFGWEKELGTFEKGKKPGINLITNVDLKNLKLTPNSEIERIF